MAVPTQSATGPCQSDGGASVHVFIPVHEPSNVGIPTSTPVSAMASVLAPSAASLRFPPASESGPPSEVEPPSAWLPESPFVVASFDAPPSSGCCP
jgi:hypothetical protein